MDTGWPHDPSVFVGHGGSRFGAYFVASVCSFRLILQRHWQRSFVSAWIVTILLFMLALALARNDPVMAWLWLVHHKGVNTRQFVVDELGRNQPSSHREAKARHGPGGILLGLQRLLLK